MTKEELKQEAEEWLCNNLHSASEEDFIKAMVDFAEPREKRIAELEATCNKWFEHLKNREEELLNELNNQNAKYNKQIEELEKENAELKDYRLTTLAKQQTDMSKYALNLEHKLSWYDDQLTKAKELLKRFIETSNPIYFEEDRQKVKAEAEQFLNSEVEK